MTVKSLLEDKKRMLKQIIKETDDETKLKQLKESLMLINMELKKIDACQKGSKNR